MTTTTAILLAILAAAVIAVGIYLVVHAARADRRRYEHHLDELDDEDRR